VSSHSARFILLLFLILFRASWGSEELARGTSQGSQSSTQSFTWPPKCSATPCLAPACLAYGATMTNSMMTFPQAQMVTMPCSQARMPYVLDPSALGLVSGGFLSSASRLNASGALGHGNCASVICVCTKTMEGCTTLHTRTREGHATLCARTREGHTTLHARTREGCTTLCVRMREGRTTP
jgi:hypothetical protein